jgi:hypothetical protein
MEAQHARALLDEGRIRIGSLDYYRNFGGDQGRVKDGGEGRLATHIDDYLVDGDRPHQSLTGAIGAAAGVKAQVRNTTILRHSRERYVYSVAKHPDRSALAELGYDAVVRIDITDLFFAAITRALFARRLITSGFQVCSILYAPDPLPFNPEKLVDPAVTKHQSMAWQREMRALWTRLPGGQPFVDLELPELRQYCSLFSFSEEEPLAPQEHPNLTVGKSEGRIQVTVEHHTFINFATDGTAFGVSEMGNGRFVQCRGTFEFVLFSAAKSAFLRLQSITQHPEGAKELAATFPGYRDAEVDSVLGKLIGLASFNQHASKWLHQQLPTVLNFSPSRIMLR